jgi:hypothetical protein
MIQDYLTDGKPNPELVKAGCNFSESPMGFGVGALETHELRIYYLDNWFEVFDSRGFLCRTTSTDILAILLRAESRPFPDPRTRPYFRPGARDFLFPGDALAYERSLEQKTLDAQARARALKGRVMNVDNSIPRDAPPETVLQTLGLSDGPIYR